MNSGSYISRKTDLLLDYKRLKIKTQENRSSFVSREIGIEFFKKCPFPLPIVNR